MSSSRSSAQFRERAAQAIGDALAVGLRHGADARTEPARVLDETESLERNEPDARFAEHVRAHVFIGGEHLAGGGLLADRADAKREIDRALRSDRVDRESFALQRCDPAREDL